MRLQKASSFLSSYFWFLPFPFHTFLGFPPLCLHYPSILVFFHFCLGSFDILTISSVQFSRSVVSDSLQPHESQHTRPPCPSPTPGVHSNSRPSIWWCHPAISSSVVPFSSCPQSLPASESFPMSQLFAWGGLSTGVSALASFLPKKSQGWSLEWTGWISLQSKGLSRVFSNTTGQKHQFFSAQLSSQSNSHPYMTTGKNIALTRWTFVGKVMSLLFNMLSRLVITFLPRSKCLLILWMQSPSAVILEPKIIKSDTVSTVSPSISWSSFSECWALNQLFHSPLSLSSKGFFVPLHFLP